MKESTFINSVSTVVRSHKNICKCFNLWIYHKFQLFILKIASKNYQFQWLIRINLETKLSETYN